MASFDPANIKTVRIYPPIGIARVGNSTEKDGWFYGPEVPGRIDTPPGGFKDSAGAVKRQAARFRVYAFNAEGEVVCEATKENGFDVEWSMEIANQKPAWYTFMGAQQEGAFKPGYTTLRNPTVQAELPPNQRDKLIMKAGIPSIGGVNHPSHPLNTLFYGSNRIPTVVYLGEASTDEQGRLVVLAGRGTSKSIADPEQPYPLIMTDFDSPNWYDDTSDGWVHAKVQHSGTGLLVALNKARVIGTTPKFVSAIYAPTTLYDLMEEVYEREKRIKEGDQYTVGPVSWYEHIWPLLERPPLLSWVNGQANGGHGPSGPGNFFDEKWQIALKDPSPANLTNRKNILGRMRLPETNSKYDKAREGQAYPYFMPWLSGDNGRTTAGDPSTFTSITELQYDRLVEWSNGNFTVAPDPPPEPPATVDELPLEDRPAALTKAALEPTIGAPLYPGIELSWDAEQSSLYNLEVPFTINESAAAGDLTKYLSLPWQSDFYMCRNYWPSVRPDAIVTEKEYNLVASQFPPEEIAKNLTKRVPWERGIHENYTDVYGDQPLFANTDMAQRWHELGFIVQFPTGSTEKIFVETQRGYIVESEPFARTLKSERPLPHGGGGVKLPRPASVEQPIDTIESLRTHLQTAMQVELSTIPLYLFGMYTVKAPAEYANDPRYYDPIQGAIRNVVAEEMLHLTLAGNVLRAIGGTPKLYERVIVPDYPQPMAGRIPQLMLHLRAMTKENLQTFIDVETPEPPDAAPEPDEYHTLGQFYAAIKQGLTYLNGQPEQLFYPETAAYQFAPGLGYQPQERDAGGSVVVTDLTTALEAITIIVEQGEGEKQSEYDDRDHLEKDHYSTFVDLQQGSDNWNLYPVRPNPNTYDYLHLFNNKQIYHVSRAFDASYCFLLICIEKLWTIDNNDSRHKLVLGNMYAVMMGVLAPLAKFLVQQPLGTIAQHAGPAFDWYEFTTGSVLKQVQSAMQSAIDAYVDVTRETQDEVPVHNYGPQLEALLPIKTSVGKLLDLDTLKPLEQPVSKWSQPGVQTQGKKGFARGA